MISAMRTIVCFSLTLALAAQTYPPAFPRPTATRLLETDRLVIWDIVWPNNKATPMHRHVHDQVGTYYQAGGRAITTVDGQTRQTTTAVGALSTTKMGTTHIEAGTTDPPLRAVFIEMKQEKGSGLPETASNVPAAFPREGAKQVLDEDRVTVWDATWTPGARGPGSRYPVETVIVWLEKGTIRVTPEGKPAATVSVVPGMMKYYARGSIEAIDALDGTPRAMVFAFK